MKAKTQRQILIVNSSPKLAPISKTQLKWAKEHCIEYIGLVSKKGVITCLNCTETFERPGTRDNYKCPFCNTRLHLMETLKRTFDYSAYFSVIDKCHGFQVIRNFKITANFKKGMKANISCFEACQIWLDNSGKFEIFGKQHYCNFYMDTWSGCFEIQNKRRIDFFDMIPYKVYPKMKLIPEIKRSGFKGDFYSLTPFDLFSNLLQSNKFETLVKAGQYNLVTHNRLSLINKYWGSICICIRNSYTIEDAGLWFDYIELLASFNKDLRNPKYVCPIDLSYQHDKYVEKYRKLQRKQEFEKLKEEIHIAQKDYNSRMANFFGLTFDHDNIRISVVEKISDFLDISNLHQHCIFSNQYYNKEDSLIMVAYRHDELLETIEVSLDTFQILQSRGKNNQPSEEHDKIIKIVNNNIDKIKYAKAS